ncbi:MAG: protein kinase [Cyanobacteria bacterium RI_101]|nr:protein kinase [Cyanobacteria bacterium RI_101]
MNHRLQPGTQIQDRYLIQRQLGQGKLSNTYLAEDTHRFGEPCVVKEFIPQEQDPKLRRTAGELFQRQAKILYGLDHPQIANFREFFRGQGYESPRFFLVRDYVEGEAYCDILCRRGSPFGEAEVLTFLRQILPVVDYLHQQGVVHRNLSLENIVRRGGDQLPVLIDFGSAKSLEEGSGGPRGLGQPSTASVLNRFGKLNFVPPQRLSLLEPELDLYCLGVATYLLLSGQSQFPPSGKLPLNDLDALPLSDDFRQFLKHLLSRQPSSQNQSAASLLRDLALLEPAEPRPVPFTSEPVAAPPEVVPPSAVPMAPPTPKPNPLKSLRLSGPVLGGCLQKLGFLVLLMALSGGLGWGVGKLWLNRENLLPAPQPQASPTPAEPQSEADFLRARNDLRARLLNLQIPSGRFNFWVNGALNRLDSAQPDQKEAPGELKDLTWLKSAQTLMDFLESLRPDVQQQLAQGTLPTSNRYWTRQVNQLRLSSRSLGDLVNARWRGVFPDLDPEAQTEDPGLTLKAAMAADTVLGLQQNETYERLELTPETPELKRAFTLAPGRGQAYVLALEAGQTLTVTLTAPDAVLLSVYSPTGQTEILAHSSERRWSGVLKESGFYEIVIVSQDKQNQKAELSLSLSASAP